MKIVVYGATGMVGSQVTQAALARGHEVTAVSRRGADVAGATALAADIIDTDTFVALAADADAVVVAIPPDRTGGPAEPMVDAHRRLIAARPDARLLVVGGAGSLSVGDGLLVDAPGFPDAYKPEAKAFTTILDDYRASSGLDWTYVSPSPVIAPGERTGYVLGSDSPVGDSVTTSDFADAIVDELETPAYKGRRFTVASKS
jgi:putative NADH-flavin reductase